MRGRDAQFHLRNCQFTVMSDDGEKIIIKIRKRSHTPILMGVEKLRRPFSVPWLDNKAVEIEWTA